METFRVLVSLMVVLGMMYAAFLWLKRRGSVPGAAAKRMRVVERLPIDGRRSILLLQVDDEEIVVGVGSDSFFPIKTVAKESDHEA